MKRRKSYWRAFGSALWPVGALFGAFFGLVAIVLFLARAKSRRTA